MDEPNRLLVAHTVREERQDEVVRLSSARRAVRNPFYRPVKQQLTVRLDADVA